MDFLDTNQDLSTGIKKILIKKLIQSNTLSILISIFIRKSTATWSKLIENDKQLRFEEKID